MPHDCVKQRIQTEPSIATRAHERKILKFVQAKRPKMWAEIDQGQLYGKIADPAPDFLLSRTSQHTGLACG
jgi:hypothetical protein